MIRRQTAGRVASAIRVCCDGKVFVRRASKTRLAMPVIPSLSEGSRCGNSKLISTRCRDGPRTFLDYFRNSTKATPVIPSASEGPPQAPLVTQAFLCDPIHNTEAPRVCATRDDGM